MGNELKKLIDLLVKIDSYSLMEDLLKGILTEKELKEITIRLEIVKRLKKREPHHKIAKELGIGVATVTRGSKELQKGRFKILD